MTREEKEEVVARYLLNKMLKPHKVDVDYVMTHQKIEDKDWFSYYTWTEEEQSKFLVEGVDYVNKTLRVGKKRAKGIMGMFLLQWGLKVIKKEDK